MDTLTELLGSPNLPTALLLAGLLWASIRLIELAVETYARRIGRKVRLNPNRIRLRAGAIHRSHVDRYKRNPDAGWLLGTPVCVVRLDDGSLFAREGAHRITAARETGRKVACLVVDERAEQGR